MNPFRRKGREDGEGQLSSEAAGGGTNPAEGSHQQTAIATNYLSFQDTATNRQEDDGDDNITQESDALRQQPRRRWFGGRRTSSNHSTELVQHRGFSTSIHDMFQTPDTERVDCCAMTCCGMLQSDRDRYFLQGVTPPSLIRRFWLHIVFPVCLFAIAGFAAFRIPDARINEAFTTTALVLFVLYIILQCLKGRAKRVEIRKDLLWTKAQLLDQRRQNLSVILEQDRPEDNGTDQEYYLGQTQRDFLAAHPCFCGCYAEDRLVSQIHAESEESQNNICNRLWEWWCPPCCGMHWQCCGVCALAQEGREVETALLPRSYLRVDYITMQPYADYYPAIYRARHQSEDDFSSNGNNSRLVNDVEQQESSSSTFPRLSRLSWQLLQVLATLVTFLILWTLTGKYFWKRVVEANIPAWRLFKWEDLVVFFVTWIHAIGLLALFVFLVNQPMASEVSLDALIKFFAAGFCLSTSLAVVWEVVLGLTVKILVSLCLALSGVDISDRPGTQMTTYIQNMGQAVADDGSSNFLQVFGKDHPVFYTLYLIVASFILAAFVEEMCKYFGYRMVEHPDFLSRREMEDAMHVVHGEFEEEDPDENHPERHDFSKQRRSFQSHGAAVTLACIAVAMGFTCCENLVYVFIYSGSSLELELSVLAARSFFPVHPLAAALQSIGVVERDIEGKRPAYLGRIIAPAVLFHGGYDFLLLWIDFLSQRNGNYVDDDDTSLLQWPVVISFTTSVLLVVGALYYYMQRARAQRMRLANMDRDDAAVRSNLI
jgi:RsiW-degrading membrane proteinase PrsW (M82 family)